MIDRKGAVAAVDALWAARAKGDIEEIARLCAPNFTLRFACDDAPFDILARQHDAPLTVVQLLIEHFRFHSTRRVTEIFEGNKLAVLWDMTLEAKGHDVMIRSEMFDLYEFDDSGRFSSMIQFVDTAKMLALLQ